jgi:hypothetical protein
LGQAAKIASVQWEAEIRERYLRRMWDISLFMKTLKQRFTQWFNRKHRRKGTLWEDRFRSVLVQAAGEPLAAMATYIDLNPIRANMVEDPKDYRWSGYGAAMGGDGKAIDGIREIEQAAKNTVAEGLGVLEAYRVMLYGRGVERGMAEDGTAMRKGFTREESRGVVESGGAAAEGGLPATSSEILHRWRSDREPGVCERGVHFLAGTFWGEAKDRGATDAGAGRRGKAVRFARPACSAAELIIADDGSSLHSHGDAHASADAEAGDAAGVAFVFHEVEQGDEDTGTAGADGMTEGDRAAALIEFVGIERELAGTSEGLHGEGFVDFDGLHFLKFPTRDGAELLNRADRAESHQRRITAHGGCGDDAGP